MTLDLGQVFSSSWTMIKQRFWFLLGMWFVFLAIQILYFLVVGGLMSGTMFAIGALGTGLDNPASLLGGIGNGTATMGFLFFYVGYCLLMFAGQAAQTALSSPLEPVNFGEALKSSFKFSLTLLAASILLGIAYLVFFIAYTLVAGVLGFVADFLAGVLVLIMLPLIIYLALRLLPLLPVVAVEKILNPIAAIRRTWEISSGNALRILAVVVAAIILATILLILPFSIIFGAAGMAAFDGGATDGLAAMSALSAIVNSMLLFFPLYIIYSIVSTVLFACMHAGMSDQETSDLEDTFS